MNYKRVLIVLGVVSISFALVGAALAADKTVGAKKGAASYLQLPSAPNHILYSNPNPADPGSRSGTPDTTPPVMYISMADFDEGFDDINNLPGWYIQNNSDPLGALSWYQGIDTVFPAHSGAPTSYIAANYNNTFSHGTISDWLLTPELTLANNAVLTFWTRTVINSPAPDRLQVRMSTAGPSTNVGTGAEDIGDFTTLLLDINPGLVIGGYPAVWTQFTIGISGLPTTTSGRFAFRYYVTDGGPGGANSNYIGVDTVEYNVPPIISITPMSLDANQLPERVTSQELHICNTGGGDLNWSISELDALHGDSILVIETAESAVPEALDDLGYLYNSAHTSDWTHIDFTPYHVVIVAMNGGNISPSSIQKVRTDVIDAGKRLIFLGGTSMAEFSAGVNQYLVLHDTTNISWNLSASPHLTVINPDHPLADGLPSPYDFINPDASYYMLRVTDPNIVAIAQNGDGFKNLFYKDSNFPPVKSDSTQATGDFIWFINTPNASFWSVPMDNEVMLHVLKNAIQLNEPNGSRWLDGPLLGSGFTAELVGPNMESAIMEESILGMPSESASSGGQPGSPINTESEVPTRLAFDPESKTAPVSMGLTTPILQKNNPQGTVFVEGFEGGVVPPEGWTALYTNLHETWKTEYGSPHAGSYAAQVLADPQHELQNEVLLSPEINITNGILDFWSFGSLYWCRDTYDNCDLNIWLVVDGWDGGGWNDIFVGTADGDWTGTWMWSNSNFDLTPLLPGGPVRIGFQYIGQDGAQVALDSIWLRSVGYIPWLDESPKSGGSTGGMCVVVNVSFNSAGLTAGDYFAGLHISSNDSTAPDVIVPVTLTVLRAIHLPIIRK